MKNILHISDFHLSSNNRYGYPVDKIEILLSALKQDLNSTYNNDVDAVFFTGDMSFSGKKDEFEILEKKFILPLLEHLNLTATEFYMVPGNHDVSRDKVNRVYAEYRASASREDLDCLSKDINEGSEPWPRNDNYLEFSKRLNLNVNNYLYNGELVQVRAVSKKLNVYCLNSAWLAQDDNDRGNLRILNQLEFVLNKYGKNKKNIVLMHHPTDWFSNEEHHAISKEVEKNVDAILFGHMHEFEQSVTINFSQDITLRLQAGTLDLRNRNSGYSLIQLDNDNDFSFGRVGYRKYCNDSLSYVPWEDRAENGVSNFSIDKSQVFDSIKFCEHSDELLEMVEYDHIINIGKENVNKKKLSSIFIKPKFREFNNEIEQVDVKKIISLDQLINIQGCALISGGDQNGKSFLLKYVKTKILKSQGDSDFRRIVFHINLSVDRFKNKHEVLMGFIGEYLKHDLLTSFEGKVKSTISNGRAVFLVDNIDKASEETYFSLMSFLKVNSKNTFIFTCDTENSIDCIKNLIRVYDGDKYSAVIDTIDRSVVRDIISTRPGLYRKTTQDEIYNSVMRLINNSHLSHNHFVYSMLLSIYEDKNDFIGIMNESDIVENYIEILLNKHDVKPSPNKPQFSDLRHFMGFLSSNLVKEKKSFITKNECLKYALEFDTLTFNDYKIEDYIDPIVSSGILVFKSNGVYEFSHVCFLYYFIAYYMSKDKTLYEYIFNNDNYLRLEKVVEYYSSLNASSFDVLFFLEGRVEELRKKINDQVIDERSINIEEIDFNELSNISLLDIASTSEDFEDRVQEYKADRTKYDEHQDKIAPLNTKVDGGCDFSELDDDFVVESFIGDRTSRYRKELSLFSKVFRSTELLMDPEKVVSIFDKIIKSYIYLIKVQITCLDDDVIFPLMIDKIEEKFLSDSVTDSEKSEIIKGFKAFLSVMKATIPNAVEMMMSEDLATKKPRFRNILKKRLVSITDDVEMLLVRFLLMDIDRSSLVEHIKYLEKNSSKVTSNTLFLKLGQMLYSRQDLNAEETKFLKSNIVKLIKSNKGIEGVGYKKLSKMLVGE